MMLWDFNPFPPLCVAEAIGICPTDHPAAREPVHHGERHADQLRPDRRLPQQPLGLDWPVQGDVAGGQGAHQSHPPHRFIYSECSWELGTETAELPSSTPRVLAHRGASSEGEEAGGMMTSLRNETILSVGLDMGPVSSQTTDHLPDPPPTGGAAPH